MVSQIVKLVFPEGNKGGNLSFSAKERFPPYHIPVFYIRSLLHGVFPLNRLGGLSGQGRGGAQAGQPA